MTHSDGTPKDLKQAIVNALIEADGPQSQALVDAIYNHVRDFEAQKFSAALYRASKASTSEEFEAVVQNLFETMFPKPERK